MVPMARETASTSASTKFSVTGARARVAGIGDRRPRRGRSGAARLSDRMKARGFRRVCGAATGPRVAWWFEELMFTRWK
jgi:hypothetical protein